LLFLIPGRFRSGSGLDRFMTSPGHIVRAYKARPGPEDLLPEELPWEFLYWLLVESRARDCVKHFRAG